MKRYFDKAVNVRIYFTCGFKAVFEDITGIEVKDDRFILMYDTGDFEVFYDADTLEEIILDFKMSEISKIEIV
jgi:hypothetical protein